MTATRYRLDHRNSLWELRDGTWHHIARGVLGALHADSRPDSEWQADGHTDLVPAAWMEQLAEGFAGEMLERNATVDKLRAAEARLARAVTLPDRLINAWSHRLDAIHADVRRLLDRKTHLAAVFGYELGHDDAKAEAADNPTGCPTCASRSCDFCDKPHPTTRFLAEAAGHICQPCRDAADAPAAAATTGEATA